MPTFPNVDYLVQRVDPPGRHRGFVGRDLVFILKCEADGIQTFEHHQRRKGSTVKVK